MPFSRVLIIPRRRRRFRRKASPEKASLCSSILTSIPIQILTFVLLVLCQTTVVQADDFDVGLLIPNGYNNQMKPEPTGPPAWIVNGTQLQVYFSVYVNDLVAVNVDNTMQVDITILEQWYDPRVLGQNVPGQTVLITRPADIRRFWLPDLYFPNGQAASVINAIESVQKLTVHADGKMEYAQRVMLTSQCVLDLVDYPHDTQYCQMRMSTLIYNRTELRLRWRKFDAFSGEYPMFRISYWYTSDCWENENPIPENYCIRGTLKLVRRLSYYIIRFYLLTFLTTAISCIQFWIPVNAWPARIVLTLVPLLNLITQDISINNDIGVYYVVSFHWWMMFLQALIYLEICEFALAIAWANFINDKKFYAKAYADAQANNDQAAIDKMLPYMRGYYFGNKGWYKKVGKWVDAYLYAIFGKTDFQVDPLTQNKVDYFSRIFFPFLYVFFVFLYVMITVIYWSAQYWS